PLHSLSAQPGFSPSTQPFPGRWTCWQTGAALKPFWIVLSRNRAEPGPSPHSQRHPGIVELLINASRLLPKPFSLNRVILEKCESHTYRDLLLPAPKPQDS